jgi:hypothetical protein
MIKYLEIKPATQKGKKLQALFYDENKKKIQTIAFGSEGMSDFTIHKDPKRKERYLARHKVREDWTVPNNAGSLSRYLLWNKTTLSASLKDFMKRFNLIKF